jgi:AcrR family transcriptional regulator
VGRRATKRQGIERAAIRLFAAKGLAATTIRDIATEAGVGEGALYRHWPGKAEMAWDLYCREVEAFSRAFEPVLAGNGRPLDKRLLAAVRFIYRRYRDGPDRLAFVLLARAGFPQQQILDKKIDPDQVVVRFLEREMDRGTLPKGDAFFRMSLLRGIVLQPVLMHRYGRLKTDPLRLARPVARACMAVLRQREDNPR